MTATLDSWGKPSYDDNTDIVADLEAAVDYAEQIGGLLKLTAAQRGHLTSGQTKVGWLIVETDTGNVYEVTADAPQGSLILGDTGWVPVTDMGGSGFTPVDIRFRRINRVVHYKIVATRASWTDNWAAVPIPTGFRPAVAWPDASFYGDQLRECSFTPGGNLAVLRAGTGGIALAGEYPVG